jgi:predicted RNA binding protein YcfA (HicA-like mRNA interferase family)
VPNTYSSKEIAKTLSRNGFELVHQRGSHAKYRNNTRPARTVILPMGRKDMRHGTFRSILEQAGMTEEEFIKRS